MNAVQPKSHAVSATPPSVLSFRARLKQLELVYKESEFGSDHWANHELSKKMMYTAIETARKNQVIFGNGLFILRQSSQAPKDKTEPDYDAFTVVRVWETRDDKGVLWDHIG